MVVLPPYPNENTCLPIGCVVMSSRCNLKKHRWEGAPTANNMSKLCGVCCYYYDYYYYCCCYYYYYYFK